MLELIRSELGGYSTALELNNLDKMTLQRELLLNAHLAVRHVG